MLGLIIGQEPSGYLGGKNGLPMHRFQRKETAADNSMRALNGPLRDEGHRSCLLLLTGRALAEFNGFASNIWPIPLPWRT